MLGEGSQTLLLRIKCLSSLCCEDLTPAGLEFFDRDSPVSNVTFEDLDLDLGQIGGQITWNEPGPSGAQRDTKSELPLQRLCLRLMLSQTLCGLLFPSNRTRPDRVVSYFIYLAAGIAGLSVEI